MEGPRVKKCDCESAWHEEMGLHAHRAGCCEQEAVHTAVIMGFIQHLCGPCMEFARNMAVLHTFDVIEK
jgi:hypothetical protein